MLRDIIFISFETDKVKIKKKNFYLSSIEVTMWKAKQKLMLEGKDKKRQKTEKTEKNLRYVFDSQTSHSRSTDITFQQV